MYRRTNHWVYVVVGLIIIGLIGQLASNPWGIILPLAIFGIIFFLYKFPPRWLLRLAQPPHVSSERKISPQKKFRAMKGKNHRKGTRSRRRRGNVKLRVIDGKKKDSPPHRKIQ